MNSMRMRLSAPRAPLTRPSARPSASMTWPFCASSSVISRIVRVGDLWTPIERRHERGQRARVAHLEEEIDDLTGVRDVDVVVLDVAVAEGLHRQIGDPAWATRRPIAARLLERAGVEAREIRDRVRAAQRIGQLPRLARDVVGLGVAAEGQRDHQDREHREDANVQRVLVGDGALHGASPGSRRRRPASIRWIGAGVDKNEHPPKARSE
jgi:hypothetical protein